MDRNKLPTMSALDGDPMGAINHTHTMEADVAEPDLPPATEPIPFSQLETGPRPRLVIQSMTLENFKSYGGQVKIGPFHKRFSSIVGPNGSGKSNVIDAMLFVFGRRAKQLRHSKMSELLHHSATHPNVTSGTVTVHFHEIIDTGDHDDDFEIVPDSEFSVARRAFKNNTSKYYLKDKEVQMKQVIALLKSKGVDLDNNRFLILQGEVEQIAMMKPKAVTAHEDGLLEYLEDIIGSNRHVEDIDAAAAKVETLNEERTHKLNRVKAAQKERDALEDAKVDAESILEKERQLHTKRAALASAFIAEKTDELKVHQEAEDGAKRKLDEAKEMVTEHVKSTKELENKFNTTENETDSVAKELNTVKDEYASFERRDIQLREDLKALKSKVKKLQKDAEREVQRIDNASDDLASHNENIAKAEEALKDLERKLKKAEAILDKVHHDIRGTTGPIRQKLEEKQKELLPYTDTVNKCTQDLDVAKMELKLLLNKRDAPAQQLAAEERTLEALRGELASAEGMTKTVLEQRENCQATSQELSTRVIHLEGNLQAKNVQVAEMHAKIAVARDAANDSSSRNRVQDGLRAASRDGRITGVIGRLGDLASVDPRYDVAVGAAIGGRLDNIVVRTAEAAQACIHLLKRDNLGQATFVILDKIQNLNKYIDGWANAPQSADGPRLFDHLHIPKSEHRVALYHALRDTLVAETLDDARRMAFKPSRKNRVVTMSGDIIEDSGAMSGGGKAPTRHRLGGGKGGNAFDTDPRDLQKAIDQLEELNQELKNLQAELAAVREEKHAAERQGESLETTLKKADMNVNSLRSRIANIVNRSLPDLRKALAAAQKESTGNAGKKIRLLEKKIGEGEMQLNSANSACEGIQSEISQLQDDIVAAGGEQLQSAKKRLDSVREQLSAERSNISKATSRAKESKKSMEKSKIAQEKIAEEIEMSNKKREHVMEELDHMVDGAAKVSERLNEAEKLHAEWSETLVQVQSEYHERKERLTKLRREELSLAEAKDAAKRKLDACKAELKDLRKKEKSSLRKLHEIHKDIAGSFGVKEESVEQTTDPMEVDGEDEEDHNERERSGGDEDVDDVEEVAVLESTGVLSSAEKRKLIQEISVLESEIGDKRPDLRAIADYKTKETECQQQVGELDMVTVSRDEERKKCDKLRKKRLDEFMAGFSSITLKLKELYQMITLGGDAELELVDSLDPFSDGILFSVRPPKKSWKNISNLSGGEKTLSSLALVFALHYFKPTPLYFLDEIDAALDFKNVSIVANYVKERTKNAQFIIISLRNNMFELADRLVGIYKTHHSTKSVTVNPSSFVIAPQSTNVPISQISVVSNDIS